MAVKRGEAENAFETAKFIPWSKRRRESSVVVRKGYLSLSENEAWESEEVNILLVICSNILIGVLQDEAKGSLWKIV